MLLLSSHILFKLYFRIFLNEDYFLIQQLKRIILILLLFIPLFGSAQLKKVGIPNILNYRKATYDAGTQNWNIAQDPDGFMYFANNDGLLRFDGLNWDLFRISSTSPVRSVCIDKDGIIYVGLDDDFGIYDTGYSGIPTFTSLKNKLPDDIRETDIIWKIYDTQYGIVFQSYQYIFIYNKETIRVIRPQKAFYYTFYVNNRLFIQEPGVGLFELINGTISKVPWADDLTNTEILSIISFYENHLLIGTAYNGWFEYKSGQLSKWDVSVNEQVEKDIMFSAVKLNGNNLAIGTILNGVIIADSDGRIIQHLNQSKGLGNNTILSLFNDHSGNLWLGLDNGVDYVELNSPLSYISSYEEISTGYCCVVYKDNLYLGTNQGLFMKAFYSDSPEMQNFELVPGTEGQVWSLKQVGDQLICGHNLGTFIIDQNKAELISEEPGAWTFVQLTQDSSYMIGGNYSGLTVYHLENEKWKFKNKVKGFTESSRFLAEDLDGFIWMSHGTKGIFRVKLNEELDSVIDVKLYGEKDGLPSDNLNILMTVDSTNIISSVKGIYRYDNTTDRFSNDQRMDSLFNLDGRLKYLQKDTNGNFWYIADSGAGLLLKNDDATYTGLKAPFRQLSNTFVREWEFLYVEGSDNVFFATEDGFVHYSFRIATSYDDDFKSFITQVEVPYLDTVVYPYQNKTELKFPFPKNAFRFHFAAPFYQNPEQLEFSFFIDNYSEKWSPWSTDNYRDLNNLPENEYIFRVRARNSFGIVSEEANYSFTISPPWFRSRLALYAYILVFILLGVGVSWVVQRRFEKTKRAERKKHEKELQKKEKEFQQQALLADKEIIRLKNEKLEAEKLYLDKELANQTLNIVNKNRFLTKINQELKRIGEDTSDSAIKTKMAIIKKRIDKEIDEHQQNKIFESYFEEVHADFYARIIERYPQLSPKDLQLCAYIRMNMATKEIATLLNITDRGVEISRYRLRKKLDLSRDVNLSTFLLNI